MTGLRESGVALALCAYAAYLAFFWKIGMRLLMLRKTCLPYDGSPVSGTTALTVLKAIGDIFFLSRLFRLNPRLWFAELLFHASFVLVALRHLRYVLDPVPGWVVFLQPLGSLAGYLLPLSLISIFIIKKGIERKDYVSRYNLFLLSLVFLISVIGLLMKTFVRPDVTAVKHFMISVFRFAPGSLPVNGVFILHYLMALVLLACLPTHIFAAPFLGMEARKREESLRLLMHEE